MIINRFKLIGYGVVPSAIWPVYLGLIAYAARQAPWPRDIALASASVLGLAAVAWAAWNLARWFFGPGGPAQTDLQFRPDVSRQCRLVCFGLVIAFMVFLSPAWILTKGLIATGGRPVIAPMAVRVLVLSFELILLTALIWVTRKTSAVICWASEHPDTLGWLLRRRRIYAIVLITPLVGIILLDVIGYSFTARRLASGGWQSACVAVICWLIYRLITKSIDRHAWRWIKVGKSLAKHETHAGNTAAPEDLSLKLKRLTIYAVPLFGLFLLSYVWDVDLALFRFLGGQHLWDVDTKNGIEVTVGDFSKALTIFVLSAVAWRHLSTFFVLVVFPRMPDDPGVRFAVVTLCRYLILAVGLLTGLSAIHLGLEKIGVVLAALGVGLGFGLQEIVSNFVCGIILLLERPIRVGDIVTVSGTTGKVDRINIRATSIINGDNQSMIVPNRAFITGELVNWTLKDKVIRVTVRVRVAQGSDPDKVADLLQGIAREDADVLLNPVPVALMEDFSDSSLVFVLFAYVPDPSLGGRVKHRLFGKIQRKFQEAGIMIPIPGHELRIKSFDEEARGMMAMTPHRVDQASPIPSPHAVPVVAPVVTPLPLTDCHRGVDE